MQIVRESDMATLFDVMSLPAQASKDNEWFTPAPYVDAARRVMGSIDLDPASCELANRTVKAARYYTKEDDGLGKEWKGNVWLNPPYGRIRPELLGSTYGFQEVFTQKLLHEYVEGRTSQAILLCGGNSSCVWFQPLYDYPICFHRGYIKFDRPDGTTQHFGYPLAIVYLGPHEHKFIQEFQKFGRIARAIDTPVPQHTTRSLWEVEA